MKNLMLTAMIVGLVVLAWHPGNGVRAAADRGTTRAVLVDAIETLEIERAPVRIASAAVDDGVLVLNVMYDGGCKVHDFELFVAHDVESGSQTAVLAHQPYGDPCDSVVNEPLRFDLSTLPESHGRYSIASADPSRIELTRAR